MNLPQVSPARIEHLIEEGYDPGLMAAFRRAWVLTMRHKWAFIGFWSAYFLLGILLTAVPIVGQLASLAIAPLVNATLIWAYYLMHLERWRDFSSFFDVVQKDLWWRLFSVYVWAYLILLLVFSPSLLALDRVGFWDWYASLRDAASLAEFPEYDWGAFFNSHVPWLILLNMLPLVYLMVGYSFSFHHALFVPEYSPWLCLEKSRQLVSRRWFDFFGYVVAVVLGVIAAGGAVVFLSVLLERLGFSLSIVAVVLLLAVSVLYVFFLIVAMTSMQGGWAVAFFRLTGLDRGERSAQGGDSEDASQLL